MAKYDPKWDKIDWAAQRQRHAEELAKGGEDPMAYLDVENNPGELTIALRNIARSMERGLSYEQAVKHHGIRGHPHFKEFWPETRYWGDAIIARKFHGLPLEDEEPTSGT